MKMYSITQEELTSNVNLGIDMYISALYKEGVLNAEQYDECKQYRIVACKKSMWGKFWDFIKFDGGKEDDVYLNVVKVIP